VPKILPEITNFGDLRRNVVDSNPFKIRFDPFVFNILGVLICVGADLDG